MAEKAKEVVNDSQITIRIPRTLQKQFAAICRAREVSQGEIVRRALNLYVNRNKR